MFIYIFHQDGRDALNVIVRLHWGDIFGHKYSFINCDWVLENCSESHIRSFEINGFKNFKPLQLAKGSKHAYIIYINNASIIIFYTIFITFSCFQTFLQNEIENWPAA